MEKENLIEKVISKMESTERTKVLSVKILFKVRVVKGFCALTLFQIAKVLLCDISFFLFSVQVTKDLKRRY